VNPFSRFLRQWANHAPLDEFVEGWDGLEKLVIQVYKSGRATAEQTAAHAALRTQLVGQYAAVAAELAPLWPQTKVGGKPARQDPFAFLLSAEQADEFVNNWAALQHLPAARQALNERLVALGQE
jgi:hypothetical protein